MIFLLYIYIYIFLCVCVCVCICIDICVCVYVHVYNIYIYIYIYICVDIFDLLFFYYYYQICGPTCFREVTYSRYDLVFICKSFIKNQVFHSKLLLNALFAFLLNFLFSQSMLGLNGSEWLRLKWSQTVGITLQPLLLKPIIVWLLVPVLLWN